MPSMELNSQMLATPRNLFNRLTPLDGKRLGGDYKDAVRQLHRPYYRLSEADYEAVFALSGNSDVLLFDGETQVTFGTADDGFALMPLLHPL